ncbi:uncharacterized protein hhla1 [Gouania willdenowi]|uniref:uncharacterized protein hhla1 n=1 Tax=Gouania willdenowi TaxID=441366 RepID=UPI0010547C26|nr:HERV-H LTR-associating protein 1 [Gouania willdenowi]
MALFLWRSHSIFLTFASTVVLYLLFTKVLRPRQMVERDTRDTMDSAAEHMDPAAMDLTPLVNALINSSQSGSRQLFSLLSVTSYSSLALHKLTLLVYNISNIRNLESQMFRRRFCYCVTNETNDLSDFAAILLDVMENSTSYLHELFKSASIVSVSQRNNSECIYICVMAGKMGRKVPELWDGESISLLFNKTIVEGPHRVANISSLRLPIGWHQLPTNLSLISPSGISSMLGSRVQSTAHGTPAPLDKTAAAMAQLLASANSSNATPQRSRLQNTTEAGATVSRTSEAGATVSRTIEAGATVSRTSEAVSTVSRTIEAGATVSRTIEAGATVSRTSEAVSTVSRTIEAAAVTPPLEPALGPTTGPPPSAAAQPKTKPNSTPITKHLVTSSPIPTTMSTSKLTTKHTTATSTTVHHSWRTTGPIMHLETEKAGCPWKRPESTSNSIFSGSVTTVSAHKLQPCIFELCKFFSQCLCRPFSHQTRMNRYCDGSHIWYEKHTFEVCRRVRRISFSRNLKQRCLMKMCNNL